MFILRTSESLRGSSLLPNFRHNDHSSSPSQESHYAGSSNNKPIGFASVLDVASNMTSLFRPWTEDTSAETEVRGMTSLFPRSDPDPWSPTPEDPADRDTRYQSVKEHVKKRTEKYLLKKSKTQKKPEAPPVFPSGTCCPPLQPLECLPPGGLPFPGDLLDLRPFPPHLLEEYARYLTQQQRHVAERSRKQRPKKFRCPQCQVGFSNNGQLKGHIRIHTGERPFKCDAESCGKSFTRNEELTRHRRIHSGLRPFPCTECGKRFGRKDHLKKHIKTHFQQRYQLVPILPSHCPYFYGL